VKTASPEDTAGRAPTILDAITALAAQWIRKSGARPGDSAFPERAIASLPEARDERGAVLRPGD
jgi:hypothetical protein